MATTSASTRPKQVAAAPKRMRGLALTTNFLKNGQMLIATGCFYALLLSLLVGVIYPSMSKLNMDAYVSSGVMTGILGSQIKHLSGFLGFTALELYSSIYGLIFGGILAYMTAAIIPVTIETGALDLALSRPIKRWRYYLEAGLAGLLGTIIISLVTVLGIWLASLMNTNPGIDWQWLWITQGAQSALLLLAVGLGLLCGSFINASRSSGGTALAIVFVFYLLNTFGGLSDKFSWMLKITPFYYAKGIDALLNHQITWWHPLLLLGVGLLCGIAGLIIFQKRDLPAN